MSVCLSTYLCFLFVNCFAPMDRLSLSFCKNIFGQFSKVEDVSLSEGILPEILYFIINIVKGAKLLHGYVYSVTHIVRPSVRSSS